jgi:prevent-host-death family protein
MQATVSDLKMSPGKFIDIAQKTPVYISKNGKRVAKLIGIQSDKVAAAEALFDVLPDTVSLDEARSERLGL